MFDFDASKLLIVGVLALIVLGPKELPRVMRQIGQAIGKMRRMASEFQGQFMDAMREAELEDIRKEVNKINDSVKVDLPSVDPAAELRKAVEGAPPSVQDVKFDETPLDIAPPEPPAPVTSESIAAELAREPAPSELPPPPAPEPVRLAPAVTTPVAGRPVELGEEISFRRAPVDPDPAPAAPASGAARSSGA